MDGYQLTGENGYMEINYRANSMMKLGFPQIKKLGAVSMNGETTPFVWNGRLLRMELYDPSHGTDPTIPTVAIIRDRETGEVLTQLGEGYYYSLYVENGHAYVIGTQSNKPLLCSDTLLLFVSTDLVHWTCRTLFTRPGWKYFNRSLTRRFPDFFRKIIKF